MHESRRLGDSLEPLDVLRCLEEISPNVDENDEQQTNWYEEKWIDDLQM